MCGGGDGGANGITRPESHGYAKHCEVNNDCFLVAWEQQKHVVSTAWPSGLKSRGNAKSVFNLLWPAGGDSSGYKQAVRLYRNLYENNYIINHLICDFH